MPEIHEDTYLITRIIENYGAAGGSGDILITLDAGDEIVEVAFVLMPATAAERLTNQVLQGINDIGADATALAEAQASLAIPAPIDPGDIAHNSLGSLQGGNGTDEFYHLTAAEHTNVGNLDTAAYEPVSSFDAAGDAAAAITAHEGDTTAHPASSIVFTPVGTIAATDTQAAVAEVATDAAAALSSEASTRASADTNLQGNIDDEATARATADSNHVAAADPHTQYQKESEKDAVSGYCGLDASARIAAARMPALTGDVTSTAGTVATSIAAGAVTLAMMKDLATDKVIGRVSSGTGVPEAMTFTDLAQTLAALTTAQAFCAQILSGYMVAQSTVRDAIGSTTALTKHGVTILIPGGSIGANGSVRVEALFGHNSSANSKRHVIQIHTSDAVGGTTLQDVTATTTAYTVMVADIGNQNATNSQRFRLGSTYAGSGSSANTTSALNTANDLYIVLASQKITSSSDTATLDNYRVWINYKA